MSAFFESVVEAVAATAPRAEDLDSLALGSRKSLDLAEAILGRLTAKVPPAQRAAAVQQAMTAAAAMAPEPFAREAAALADRHLADRPEAYRRRVADYLTLFPARIRATFARPADPTGATALAGWMAKGAEDLVVLLPPRPPRFRKDEFVPGTDDEWLLIERLGIGGFGEVWKAQSATMGNTFRAFKFCLDPASQEAILKNELKNIELVQNELADHPNVVKLIAARLKGDAPWLQYEYVPGGDLGQNVATWGGDLAVRAALAVEKVAVLARTLGHCHDLKPDAVIHRDMKPANVLLGRNGTLKITDFGISNTQARHALDEARLATVTNTTLRYAATPLYASRQQQAGDPPHPADDVHALGVMLFQLVLGDVTRPLDVDYVRVLESRHVCRELIALISRSIASDVPDRYQNGGELAEALAALPKKLIAEPVVVSQVDLDKQLYAQIDEKAADARLKNAAARTLLDQRKWAEAVATLEGVFHPVLRDEGLYLRAVAHRDGKRFVNGLGMEFAIVPKGTFWMGGQDGTCGTQRVTIDQDFFMGVYPVTQEEWQKVMGDNPSYFRKGGGGADKLGGATDAEIRRFPVECVSWNDCQTFVRKLNEKNPDPGWMYRLPREAEWEYTCRGGATSQADCAWSFYFQAPTNTLSPQQANFSESNIGRTCQVGLYPPNALGIHDLHGNVWEWCEDVYNGSLRVYRGGSWYDSAGGCRAGYRCGLDPGYRNFNLGLRVARVPVR